MLVVGMMLAERERAGRFFLVMNYRRIEGFEYRTCGAVVVGRMDPD